MKRARKGRKHSLLSILMLDIRRLRVTWRAPSFCTVPWESKRILSTLVFPQPYIWHLLTFSFSVRCTNLNINRCWSFLVLYLMFSFSYSSPLSLVTIIAPWSIICFILANFFLCTLFLIFFSLPHWALPKLISICSGPDSTSQFCTHEHMPNCPSQSQWHC